MACHGLQRLAGRGGAVEALHQLVGLVGAAAHAEPEHDLARLALGQLQRHMDRSAGVERRAGAARQARAAERGGAAHRAVAPDELVAVTADGAERTVCVVDDEEADPVAMVVAVGVACIQRAAVRRDLGDHMRRRLRAQIAQHPFDIAGGRQPPRPVGAVAQRQHRELDRRVERHEDLQPRFDAVFHVLEDADAEAVARDVAARRRGRAARSATRRWPVSSSRR